jgi:hypothetical protein
MKGIALAYPFYKDITDVKASWFYVWGSCNVAGCVPMSRNGEDPNLPPDYNGYILLFNEPNNPEPYGHPIDPLEAVVIYLQLCDKYSHAKWVVGNVSAWGLDWLCEFYTHCDRPPQAYGMHGYVEGWITPQDLMNWWTEAHDNLGGDFWITEFADSTGNTKNDEALVKYFKANSWIKRWAYFTNRAKGDEPWYPSGWNVQLFDQNGKMTKIGRWYSGKHFVFLPIIHRNYARE